MALDWTARGICRMVVQTVTNPTAVAASLMTIKQPRSILWAALVLAGVLTALQVSVLLLGQSKPGFNASPLTSAVVFTSFLIALVFMLFYCSRALSGTGTFGDTITLVAWFQFTMFVLQFIQTIVFALVPPLGGLLSMIGLFLSFYILVSFVNVLHGFGSTFKALVVIFLSFFGVAFGLAILLTLISAVFGLGVPNV